MKSIAMKHCGSVMNLATRDDPGVVTICDNKEYRNIKGSDKKKLFFLVVFYYKGGGGGGGDVKNY